MSVRAPRALLGILASFTGILLLFVHLHLHPIPLSARELRDHPAEHREVVLTTDNAVVVGEREDGVKLVAIDSGGPFLIYVYPGFEGAGPETGGLHVFDAVYPGSAPETRWVPTDYTIFEGSEPRQALLLENVVWSYGRAQVPPPAWLAGAGIALFLAGLVAFGWAYGAAGVAAGLGFIALHGAAQTSLLTPRAIVALLAWACFFAGWLVLATGAARRDPRPWIATAAATLGFAVGVAAEHALFGGYRPFTGIL